MVARLRIISQSSGTVTLPAAILQFQGAKPSGRIIVTVTRPQLMSRPESTHAAPVPGEEKVA